MDETFCFRDAEFRCFGRKYLPKQHFFPITLSAETEKTCFGRTLHLGHATRDEAPPDFMVSFLRRGRQRQACYVRTSKCEVVRTSLDFQHQAGKHLLRARVLESGRIRSYYLPRSRPRPSPSRNYFPMSATKASYKTHRHRDRRRRRRAKSCRRPLPFLRKVEGGVSGARASPEVCQTKKEFVRRRAGNRVVSLIARSIELERSSRWCKLWVRNPVRRRNQGTHCHCREGEGEALSQPC